MAKVAIQKSADKAKSIWSLFDANNQLFNQLQQRTYGLFEERGGNGTTGAQHGGRLRRDEPSERAPEEPIADETIREDMEDALVANPTTEAYEINVYDGRPDRRRAELEPLCRFGGRFGRCRQWRRYPHRYGRLMVRVSCSLRQRVRGRRSHCPQSPADGDELMPRTSSRRVPGRPALRLEVPLISSFGLFAGARRGSKAFDPKSSL